MSANLESREIGERAARLGEEADELEADGKTMPEDAPTRIHRLIVKSIETAFVSLSTASILALVYLFAGFFDVPSQVAQFGQELHVVEVNNVKLMELLEKHQKSTGGELSRLEHDITAMNSSHTAQIAEALRRIEAHRVQIATLTQALFGFEAIENKVHGRDK